MGTMPTLMEDDLYNAAINGNTDVLISASDSITYQTTPTSNNIIHVAADHNKRVFIREALWLFPELGRKKNSNMDTPLHVAARQGNKEAVELLISYNGCAKKAESEAEEYWLWMAKNLQGDTPLHLALSRKKLEVAMDLLKVGHITILALINCANQTPLHVFIKSCTGTHITAKALLEKGVMNLQGVRAVASISANIQGSSTPMQNILKELLKYKPAMCICDNKGRTPVHIAAQRGCLEAVQLMINHCPQSAEIWNSKGKNVLHLLTNSLLGKNDWELKNASPFESLPSRYHELKEFIRVPEINALKDMQDSYGNTPSNVAMRRQDFVMLRALFDCDVDLTIKNKRGISTSNLMMSMPDFPTKMVRI